MDVGPRPGCLVAIAGGIGSGKSTIAGAVSARLSIPVHSIDDDKRHVGATWPDFDRWVADGIPFPDDFRREVYDRTLIQLRSLAVGHPVVIVEETFHRKSIREPFFEAAEQIFGRVFLVEVRASPAAAIAHLERRSRTEEDHLAGKAMYDAFSALADPLEAPDLIVENNGALAGAVNVVCAGVGDAVGDGLR